MLSLFFRQKICQVLELLFKIDEDRDSQVGTGNEDDGQRIPILDILVIDGRARAQIEIKKRGVPTTLPFAVTRFVDHVRAIHVYAVLLSTRRRVRL